MKRVFRRLWMPAVSSLALCGAALAQAPTLLPFQASLVTKTGQPVNSDGQLVSLSLYDAAEGGALVYSETKVVRVTRGVLSTTIGSGNPAVFAALPFNVPYWIGVKIGGDAEMTPRIPLGAVPYALAAQSVPYSGVSGAPANLPPNGPAGGDLSGSYPNPTLPSRAALLSKVSGGAMVTNGFGVGVGVPSPNATLDVGGPVQIRANNTLEFGAGLSKQGDAGKIGYGTFTVNTLDIVGAGATAAERRIKFHAEGGAVFSGWVGIGTDGPQAPLHIRGNQGVLNLEGVDHAYMQFFPRGFGSGRKAYIGFPSAGSHNLEIANEDGGQVRVIGTFVNNSDARYKTNVAPLPHALASVMALRGVSYDWRTDLPGLRFPAQRQIGFLAQEVERALPDLVYTDERGEKSVAYINVVPVLVEAMKAQQREIVRLRAAAARVDALEARLKRLERAARSR